MTTLTQRGRRGVEVGQLRARLRRELKVGQVKLSEVLRDEAPDWLGSVTAERLLLWAPRVGPSACASLLQEARLGPMQEARHITVRQRNLLADELEKIENLKPKSGKRARTKFERGVR